MAELATLRVWVIGPAATTTPCCIDVCRGCYDRAPTTVTSQVPVELWHEHVGSPTSADAVLDRLGQGFAKVLGFDREFPEFAEAA